MSAPDLGKMIGPLPLGAWVAVVGTGVGLVVYTRRNAPAPSTVDAGIPEDVGTTPGVGVGGSWVAVPPPTSAPPTAPAPVSNEEWAVQAINGLIAMRYPPATVDSAIRKYISGASDTLSVSEWAVVRVALGMFGSPPQPLPPSASDPGTVPPTGTTPAPGAPRYVMRLAVRNTMYGLMRTSHPTLSAAAANNRAAVAIDYNRSHGINPWGSTPRAQATQKSFTGRVWVF